MPLQRKSINLGIQGGGARGAFTWGILDKFLEDKRLNIEGVSATSAGSLNAIVLAQGLMEGGRQRARELLEELWRMISQYGKLFNPTTFTLLDYIWAPFLKMPINFLFFNILINSFSPYEFNPYNINPLKLILNELVDIEQIKKNKSLKLFFSATDVKTGKLHIFSNEELSIDAILASSCLPYLFQAVEIEGEHYWDGGYVGNPAIFPLIYHCDSKDIIILHTSPVKRDNTPMNTREIMHRITEISFNSSLQREMRVIAYITQLIEEGWIKKQYKNELKRIYMHSIESDDVLKETSMYSRYDTNWSHLLKLFNLGRKSAKNWLDQNFNHLGKKSTVDFSRF